MLTAKILIFSCSYMQIVSKLPCTWPYKIYGLPQTVCIRAVNVLIFSCSHVQIVFKLPSTSWPYILYIVPQTVCMRTARVLIFSCSHVQIVSKHPCALPYHYTTRDIWKVRSMVLTDKLYHFKEISFLCVKTKIS